MKIFFVILFSTALLIWSVAEINADENDLQSITDYDKAIELNPDDAKAYFNRGLAYGDLGQHWKAFSDYLKPIQLTVAKIFGAD